jgi:hypothetical protein
MDKDEYLNKMKDCNVWFDYAKNQKNVAENILHNCILAKKFPRKLKDDSDYNLFVTLWSNAHYHYGIAIENGLKGIIIKHQPEIIDFEVKDQNVILKSIGGQAGKTHNLLRLAEISGIFDSKINLYSHSFDYESLKRVLQHLSDMIKWGARYPIPNNLNNIYKFDGVVPSVLIYGFHILDVMEPLFTHFEKERN